MATRFCRLRTLAIFGTLGAVGATAVLEEVGIQVNKVDVRGGKSSMSAIVATLHQNDHMGVLEKETNGWWRVKTGDKEGWVYATALTPPKGGYLGLPSGHDADPASAGLAARGIDPTTIQYAANKHYNLAPLLSVKEGRERVTGARFDRFTAEGKVGPARH